jgi:hypothetical protein
MRVSSSRWGWATEGDPVSKTNKQTKPKKHAHACNPSYSGGRAQEDRRSKPAWANGSRDPILKNPSHTHIHTHTHTHTHTQIGLVEWLRVAVLNSNHSTEKKKSEENCSVWQEGGVVSSSSLSAEVVTLSYHSHRWCDVGIIPWLEEGTVTKANR